MSHTRLGAFDNEVGYDMLGNKLELGDLVLCVTANDTGKVHRTIGRVKKFCEQKTTIVIVYSSSYRWSDSNSASYNPERIVKIPEDYLQTFNKYLEGRK